MGKKGNSALFNTISRQSSSSVLEVSLLLGSLRVIPLPLNGLTSTLPSMSGKYGFEVAPWNSTTILSHESDFSQTRTY
nr:hypothetical protein CFP56_35560 [Quercus suber]